MRRAKCAPRPLRFDSFRQLRCVIIVVFISILLRVPFLLAAYATVCVSPSSGSLVRPLLKSDHGEQGKSISLCAARLFVRCANGRNLENRCRCDSIKCRGTVYLRFHFWRNKKKTKTESKSAEDEKAKGRSEKIIIFPLTFFCSGSSVCICAIRS